MLVRLLSFFMEIIYHKEPCQTLIRCKICIIPCLYIKQQLWCYISVEWTYCPPSRVELLKILLRFYYPQPSSSPIQCLSICPWSRILQKTNGHPDLDAFLSIPNKSIYHMSLIPIGDYEYHIRNISGEKLWYKQLIHLDSPILLTSFSLWGFNSCRTRLVLGLAIIV